MIARKYGALRDAPNHRDHLAAPPVALLDAAVDLRAWMPPIRDQGGEGACTAFAGTAILSWLIKRFQGEDVILSPQFLYRAERLVEGDPATDGGAQSRTMAAVLTDTGCCLEASDPYVETGWLTPTSEVQLSEAQGRRVGAFHRVADLDTLRGTLLSGYPASLGIQVYESFESAAVAKSGVVTMPAGDEALMGGHEVVACGDDPNLQRILVRNSWGEDWGIKGYFWLPYEYWEGLVMDSWLLHLGPAWKKAATRAAA